MGSSGPAIQLRFTQGLFCWSMKKDIVAKFTPIGVTFETIDLLTRDKQMDALALYMAYAAIAEWQKTNAIKATKNFMLERTGWSKQRYERAKRELVDRGLIENVRRTDKDGKTEGWYVSVNHIVTTTKRASTLPEIQEGGKSRGVEIGDTSAFNTSKVLINTNFGAPSAEAQADIFSVEKEITKLLENKRKDLRAIGVFLQEKHNRYGLRVVDDKQWQLLIKRHIKDAKLIADNITSLTTYREAMEKAFERVGDEATVGTVIKYLTK